ncbi:hypothetical protein CANCADRAFT_30470 [Tortispora caseinolytica NRRL Y-17796]|uniref:Amidase domain-containing protein n=1 Tax=Tortispora caseinolytica NRRL Y-17796 TaxID=767744 RepID=A0A1E4TKH3_9ASCO|nr:hypothetical protein CANCADRAFT_30470 [Tortispora caseinolytica NRRL Y-17796]
MTGNDAIGLAIGPITRSLFASDLFMQVMIDYKPYLYDHTNVAIPWTPAPKPKKLRIGVEVWDGYVMPHPPIVRAIKELEAKIKAYKGDVEIEVVPYESYKPWYAWSIISQLYYPDAGADDKRAMDAVNEPHCFMTDYIMNHEFVKPLSVTELWAKNHERDVFRSEHAEYWHSKNIDVLICPASPFSAPKPHTTKYWPYTSHWNLVDYPSIIFPVSEVKETDLPVPDYKPVSPMDEFVYNLYGGPEEYAKSQVALQLVGFRYQDEKVFAAMSVIEEIQKS